MSNTYTPNIQLAMPASGDRTWNVALNANASAIDALNAAGDLAVITTEVPSATLDVQVRPGVYLRQDGTVGTLASPATLTLSASATSQLYLDLTDSGAPTASTSGWPATAHVRLATAVTGASTVTSIADARVAYAVVGSFLDGVNLTFGTSTGTQVGTSAAQKIGFFGATPVVRPTMGAATAGSSYTSNEQAMLNAVYSAIRALGLGS